MLTKLASASLPLTASTVNVAVLARSLLNCLILNAVTLCANALARAASMPLVLSAVADRLATTSQAMTACPTLPTAVS